MEPKASPERPPLYKGQESYYETVFRRPNAVKEAVLGFFFSICSYPRLVLEVFIRRNMGERYFSFTAVVIIFVLMLCVVAYTTFLGYLAGSAWIPFGMNLGLIAFSFAFLYFGIQRNREIKLLPSVFDFARFSLSTGSTLPFFEKYTTDRRKLTTRYEPAVFFLAGLVCLLPLQLTLAYVLISCSIIYWSSYVAAYYQGDNFLMDKIDERICKQDLGNTFRKNLPFDQTRGAEFFGSTPEDPEMRERMGGLFDDTAHEVS